MFKALIIGAPLAGKGTISKRIVNTFKLQHISSGDLLRANIKQKTALGQKVQQYIDSGNLVPDDVMTTLILSELTKCNHPWLLDGFPRTVAQAEQLVKEHQLQAVLNLVVPFEIIIDRVKGRWIHAASGRVYNVGFSDPKVPGKDDITGEPLVQREDDKPDIVQKRLDLYERLTKPVLEFYKQHNLLSEFKGNTSDEIWPNVKLFLEQKIKK